MPKRTGLLQSALLMAGLGLAGGLASAAGDGFLLGGIQVNEPDLDHWAATLRDVGMNTVSIPRRCEFICAIWSS